MMSIYSTKDGMAYQHGLRRTLITKTGAYLFQVKEDGEWREGRNSYAKQTVEKVKTALGK
jgi:hypothetical protein